jgi:transposase
MNEFTLVVGADIAKHKHYARAVDFRGIELGKPLVFTNLREAFQGLLQWIYSVPHLPEGIYAELRNGMNLRERISQELTRVQGRIQNWLDRFFPEFTQVFKDWQGKASYLTLKQFPLPQDVLALGAEKIVGIWKKEVKRAEQLVQTAKKSVGLTTGTRMARYELQALLRQYDLLIEEMEHCMREIEVILSEIPGVTQMITIPGVGWVTVAGFLAEVGNLSHYSHPRQIQKLAGLNLKENSSGKHKGQTHITKRGRPRLRALLFRCILPLVAKNEDFKALHEEYTTRSVNPLKKKQSLIALCCKLIRILFALGRNNEVYDSSKWRKPPARTLQVAA